MTGGTDEAKIEWVGSVPVSRVHDDPYFSKSDGLAETRHVFLQGNGLPARFRPGFRLGELGFGTGLSFLAAWQAWEASGVEGALDVTSFEQTPLSAAQMRRALATWPELAPWADRLLQAWPAGRVDLGTARLTLILGDVRQTLPAWGGTVDAWFLDGFAPARNPEMWEPALLSEVARHTRPGGSFATYTAAGRVRRALAAAGFSVRKVAGYGTKREMTVGALPA